MWISTSRFQTRIRSLIRNVTTTMVGGKKCYCVHIGIRAAKSSYFQLLNQLQLRLTKNQNQKELQLRLMKKQLVHRTAPKSKFTGFSQYKQQLKMCTAGRSVVRGYLSMVDKKHANYLSNFAEFVFFRVFAFKFANFHWFSVEIAQNAYSLASDNAILLQ